MVELRDLVAQIDALELQLQAQNAAPSVAQLVQIQRAGRKLRQSLE